MGVYYSADERHIVYAMVDVDGQKGDYDFVCGMSSAVHTAQCAFSNIVYAHINSAPQSRHCSYAVGQNAIYDTPIFHAYTKEIRSDPKPAVCQYGCCIENTVAVNSTEDALWVGPSPDSNQVHALASRLLSEEGQPGFC
jgi:hypothetical protein